MKKLLQTAGWINALVLWGSFVACSWCEGVVDVSKLKGKKSPPGVDAEHHLVIINPVDAKNVPADVKFDWSKARDPFRRVK